MKGFMMKGLFLVAIMLSTVGLCGSAFPDEAALRIGTASATINPEPGTYLAGYGHNRTCTGVHDDLFAKAVVFDDGETAVALVVLDAISLQYPTVQAIRRAAAEKTTALDLPPGHIAVQATHTHCAPDTIGIYGPDPLHTGVDPTYMERLVETAAEQVAEAARRLQPASLRWAQTVCRGWAVNDSEPGELDNSVTILQCADEDGKPRATLTNFACHPTVLGGDTTLASADWTGTFYQKMSAALPGEHLFLQGGVGGWVQPKTPERTFALAARYGADLAEKTLAALEHTKPVDGARIRVARKEISLPIANDNFKQMAAAGLTERGFDEGNVATEVMWFAVGNAQFATHFGETAPEYTQKTRELMDTGSAFVLGLGLDHLGYICPARFFERPEAIPFAAYQVSMSPGRDAGRIMMKALGDVIP